MPDLIHHHLTGESATESCITSTSQLTNWKTLDWDWDLIELCHLPKHLFPPIHPTGTLLGPLSSALAERLKVPRWQVCQTGGHDTACAVAAAPLSSTPELVISSGTWSMLGIEVAEPIISAEAAQLVCGSYVIPGPRWCFMRGVMGLWLLERFRHEENLGPVGELVAGASQSRSKSCLFDPQAELFQSSLSFREALTQWCIATRQPIPQETSGIVRSILESLALFCHEAMENLAKLAGRELRQVVIVGGGSRNRLLNQLIANATGLPVRVGHAESTVIGNLLCQAVGMGALTSFDEIRGVVNCSFPTEEYLPQDQEQREEKRDRYRKVKGCE
jgi:sugar (pentulose or hexulose) kinase